MIPNQGIDSQSLFSPGHRLVPVLTQSLYILIIKSIRGNNAKQHLRVEIGQKWKPPARWLQSTWQKALIQYAASHFLICQWPIQDELGHGPGEHLHQLLICALLFSQCPLFLFCFLFNGDHFFLSSSFPFMDQIKSQSTYFLS